MATRIGINGFGRIGRLVARAALSHTYQDRLDWWQSTGLRHRHRGSPVQIR